jgi:dipeptidyl-peptidase-4
MNRRKRLPLALSFAVICWTLAEPAAAQQGKQLTVERIWGQPSLSGSTTQGLQWSPDGKQLSFYQRTGQDREARTDIWVMNPATGEKKMLVETQKLQSLVQAATEQTGAATVATGLGRAAPARYQWAPQGDAMLLVVQGNLVWFDLKAQTGKRLTSSKEPVQDPKISPDAKWVSFVRQHNVWLVDVASGKERQLTRGGSEDLLMGQLDWVYPEELSIRTAYWWSPDASKLAFLEMNQQSVSKYPLVDFLSFTGKTEFMRYPKAGDTNPAVRVGVINVKGGKPVWMDTGAEKDIYLARVDWLRDSKRVAIQRMNRAQNKLELIFADAGNGRSSVILTEEDKFWINVTDDLHFFSDGSGFLWSSERGEGGYAHLYSYDLSGKLQKQITSGRWEVTAVTRVDERNRGVYFTAAEKTPTETHLYRVGLDGSGFARVTKEAGVHGINMSPDASFFVDSYSNWSTPTRQDLYRTDGTRVQTINENKVAELAEYNVSPMEFLKVKGADGTELNAFLIKPVGFDASKKYPVIVYTYGGPHAQIVRNAWGGANFLWHQMMAQKGFIIFGVDNRGSSGRGHAFESAIHRRFGENELADQVAGVNYLKSLPYVDGARVGIWGWSFGGYMTCYAMLNAPDVFKAGFAGAPVTDWRQYDTIYTERYMSRPQDNAEGYKKSSPATHAANLKGKLMIAHGTADDNVHYANTMELSEEFIKAGKYAEVYSYPGRGHGVGDATARVHLFRRVTQFFVDHL